MKFWTTLTLLIALVSTAILLADRGSIPFRPYVKIFEPKQRALIAWNGDEQILLLITDLYASSPTKVLEVLPLPSEPKVKKGNTFTYKKAARLIYRRRYYKYRGPRRRNGDSRHSKQPAGKITFHKKIGAHDIAIANVLHAGGFVRWVNSYLRKHIIKRLMVSTLAALGGLALLAWLLTLDFTTIGFSSQANTVWLKLWFISLAISPVSFFFSPLGAYFSRKHEKEADQFAVDMTGENGSMMRALSRLSADNLSQLNPHPLVWKWSYSHPPVLERLKYLEEMRNEATHFII